MDVSGSRPELGSVAEKITWLHYYGPRYGDTFDHTAAYLGGIELVGVIYADAFERLVDDIELIALGKISEYVERKLDILLNGEVVEKGAP